MACLYVLQCNRQLALITFVSFLGLPFFRALHSFASFTKFAADGAAATTNADASGSLYFGRILSNPVITRVADARRTEVSTLAETLVCNCKVDIFPPRLPNSLILIPPTSLQSAQYSGAGPMKRPSEKMLGPPCGLPSWCSSSWSVRRAGPRASVLSSRFWSKWAAKLQCDPGRDWSRLELAMHMFPPTVYFRFATGHSSPTSRHSRPSHCCAIRRRARPRRRADLLVEGVKGRNGELGGSQRLQQGMCGSAPARRGQPRYHGEMVGQNFAQRKVMSSWVCSTVDLFIAPVFPPLASKLRS